MGAITQLSQFVRGQAARRTLAAAVGATIAACWMHGAMAQGSGYPTKIVRFVVPYSAGGPVDGLARPLAQKLTERWGQPIVVDNRPGASATIGTTTVARATPDGYTLLVCNAGEIGILPSTMAKLPYDPVKDFAPVTQLVSGPMVFAIHPGLPFKTLTEFVNAAKAQPAKLSYGSVGQGSISHLAGEMLSSLGKIELIHSPYKGAAPVITDLLGGHVNTAFLGISVTSSLITAGKLRALAVSTTKRSTVLPDVPAIAELYPGFEVNSWYGMMAPAGTPRAIVQQVYNDIVAVMRQPEFAEMLKARGSEVELSTPEQFAVKIREDIARYAQAVKTAGITPSSP